MDADESLLDDFHVSDIDEEEREEFDTEQHQQNIEFFDDEMRLIIDKNEPELNEVEEFMKKLLNHPLKTCRGIVFKNFWTLICCTSGDYISTQGRQMSERDLFNTAANSFQEATNSLLKKSHLKESIFKYVSAPGSQASNSQYPEDFLQWVSESKRSSKPSKPFKKKYASVIEKEDAADQENAIQALWYGHRIWETYKEAKKIILSRLNVLWIPLRSGENIYSLYCSIRKTLYDNHADELAKVSIHQKYKPNKRAQNGIEKPSQTALQQQTKEVAKLRYDELVSTKEWYPDCWLSFIALGAPSGSHQLVSLTSGFAKAVNNDTSVVKMEVNMSKKSRDARQVSDSLNAGFSAANAVMTPIEVKERSQLFAGTSSASSTEKATKKNEVHFVISKDNQEVSNLQIVLRMYQDLLTDEPDNEEFKQKLKATRLKIIALLEK